VRAWSCLSKMSCSGVMYTVVEIFFRDTQVPYVTI
jgi:hypothetical protein